MKKQMKGLLVSIFLIVLAQTLTACSQSTTSSSLDPALLSADKGKFLSSGSLLVSHKVPARSQNGQFADAPSLDAPKPPIMAPLMGYFPPAAAYLPADNETWLEIITDEKRIVLRKGKESVKEIAGEGEVNIEPGEYYLQHKEKQPVWYAPDEYFSRRKLQTPDIQNRLRYRKGALGQYVLYPTTTFAIHCAPVWSEDVGGLRVDLAELSSIYYMLPIGAPIVVR